MEYRIAVSLVELQNTRKKIIAIAFETGFPTLSSYNRAFKNLKGCSPRAWRGQNGSTTVG